MSYGTCVWRGAAGVDNGLEYLVPETGKEAGNGVWWTGQQVMPWRSKSDFRGTRGWFCGEKTPLQRRKAKRVRAREKVVLSPAVFIGQWQLREWTLGEVMAVRASRAKG